ncbi:hypothetical protein ACLI4Z_18545 [Natrialbaceae archaeon A-arb3/5]
MDRARFVELAVVAFVLVAVSFVVRGFGQLLVGRTIAELLQLPIVLVGFGLFVYLFVRATLDAVGLWKIERSEG